MACFGKELVTERSLGRRVPSWEGQILIQFDTFAVFVVAGREECDYVLAVWTRMTLVGERCIL